MILLIFAGMLFLIIVLLSLDYIRLRKVRKQLHVQVQTSQDESQQRTVAEQQLKKTVTSLRQQLEAANLDPVTHLLSPTIFKEKLQQGIRESARFDLTMAVLFVDIDNFSMINAGMGYEVGNTVLQSITERLKTCVRQVDHLCRLSNDTFAILVTQLAKPETAAFVAQRILQTLTTPLVVAETELNISVCIGITIFPNDGQDATTLLQNAEQALKIAQQHMTHSYQFYAEELHAKSQRELMLYNKFNRDTIFKEFVLYFQPIVKASNRHLLCMHALIHWALPEVDLVKPEELLHLAKRQHKLNAVSEWLIKNACLQFMQWQKLDFQAEFLSVPLSVHQLENSRLVYQLSLILQELKFNPKSLLIEVKVDTEVKSFAALEKSFNMLKYLGIKITLDGFGGHYASLAYLKYLQPDYLKLDEILVSNLQDNKRAILIIENIMQLAQRLQVELIVPAVNDEATFQLLKQLGIEYMQGAYLGLPILSEQVGAKI